MRDGGEPSFDFDQSRAWVGAGTSPVHGQYEPRSGRCKKCTTPTRLGLIPRRRRLQRRARDGIASGERPVANRHGRRGNDERHGKRDGRDQFERDRASPRQHLLGSRRRETGIAGQLCHGRHHPSRISSLITPSLSMPAPVRPDSGEGIEEQRRFGGSWLTDG